MARGNEILINGQDPKGRFTEGFVKTGLTVYPGMLVIADPTVAIKGGRFTYKFADLAAAGGLPIGSLFVVLADSLRGAIATDSFAAGSRLFLYSPLPGDELNLLLDATGNATRTAGETQMLGDNTGKLVAVGGAEKEQIAQLMETVTTPAADALAWCTWMR
jgi:hypothetical protein